MQSLKTLTPESSIHSCGAYRFLIKGVFRRVALHKGRCIHIYIVYLDICTACIRTVGLCKGYVRLTCGNLPARNFLDLGRVEKKMEANYVFRIMGLLVLKGELGRNIGTVIRDYMSRGQNYCLLRLV